MKVIIAGGRNFNDYKKLEEICDFKLKNQEFVEIVCGMAKGADMLGYWYASKKGLPIACFPADWGTYGKAAGPIRNKEMVEYSDALIAFWDGKSRGTKNVIDLAKERGLKIKIVYYKFEYV